MIVPEIEEIKEILENLRVKNIVRVWELPYENLLTRRSAAIFFVDPVDGNITSIEHELSRFKDFSYRKNDEKKLSVLPYRVTFTQQEIGKSTPASVR
ncbi:hypothetical protein BH09BAC3_BH09BAC3_33840 [soil metagenome]